MPTGQVLNDWTCYLTWMRIIFGCCLAMASSGFLGCAYWHNRETVFVLLIFVLFCLYLCVWTFDFIVFFYSILPSFFPSVSCISWSCFFYHYLFNMKRLLYYWLVFASSRMKWVLLLYLDLICGQLVNLIYVLRWMRCLLRLLKR